MEHDLEVPGTEDDPDWDSLYRARGDEVVLCRPIFTGDVFEKVAVHGAGEVKTKNIIVIQHPCALRTDGVTLHPRLLVAEVRKHSLIEGKDWRGHTGKMPLPVLYPNVDSGKRHQAAIFDSPYLVEGEALDREKRISCMSQLGCNLLLQRWVHFNSRAVIPTPTYDEVVSPAYEEADLIEEWCEDRLTDSLRLPDAEHEAMGWLRDEQNSGQTRQSLLEDPQRRSAVRQEMRSHLRGLRTSTT